MYVAGGKGNNMKISLEMHCLNFQCVVFPLLFIPVLQEGLATNFQEASVDVVDCPDLTQSPWTLAAPGELVGGYSVCAGIQGDNSEEGSLK